MFKNVGGKIKLITEILMWLSFMSFPIYGFVIIINDKDVLKGIIVILLGIFLTWVSSVFLYGFGQLIENSDKIVETMEKQFSENNIQNWRKEVLMTEEEEFKKWRDEGLITEEEYINKRINN